MRYLVSSHPGRQHWGSETCCRVTLTRSGWERMENGEQMREVYNIGWGDIVERIFAEYAA